MLQIQIQDCEFCPFVSDGEVWKYKTCKHEGCPEDLVPLCGVLPIGCPLHIIEVPYEQSVH